MRCLIDTNVLLRFVNSEDALHPMATRAIDALHDQGTVICVVPQNIYEFWAVATRPQGINGLGWQSEQLRTIIDNPQTRLLFLDDHTDMFAIWLELVTNHGVSGKPAHDARLAAAYLAHDLDALLTLNAPDFKRFGITVLNPADFS